MLQGFSFYLVLVYSICYVFAFKSTGNTYNDRKTLRFVAPQKDIHQEGNVIFNCSVNWSMDLISHVSWYKDDNLIPSYQRDVEYKNGKLVMIIENFSYKRDGLYSCLISVCFNLNIDGVCPVQKKIKRQFLVMSPKPPHIREVGNIRRNFFVGDTMKLSCAVSRHIASSYKWFHNGNEVTKTRFTKIRRFSFLKVRAMLNNSGDYLCLVKNKFGASNITYRVTVTPNHNRTEVLIPQITNKGSVTVGYLGETKKIKCAFRGSPPFEITWYKNDKKITTASRDGHHHYIFDDNRSILRISHLYPSDCGLYTCHIQNKYGGDNRTVELITFAKIQSGPYFKRDHASHYLGKIGDSFGVEVDVLASQNAKYALLQFQPYKEDEFVENKKITVLKDYGDNTLDCHRGIHSEKVTVSFKNITWNDVTNYTLVATNSYGSSSYHFEIMHSNSVGQTSYKSYIEHDQDASRNIIEIVSTILFVVIVTFSSLMIFLWKRKSSKSAYGVGQEGMTLTTSGRLIDSDFEIPFSNLRFTSVIGEGEFGQVLLGEVAALPNQSLDQPLQVAIKTTKENATHADVNDFLFEIQTMKNIGNHPNIIGFLGEATFNERLFMILEYCCHGNLKTFLNGLESMPSEEFYSTYVIPFCLQVAHGMKFLERRKCIHRDLAARNVLVADRYVLKICDFGLARNVNETDYYRKMTGGRLPIKWMAIEAIFDRVFSAQTDIWSFGVVCWEICTRGETPYSNCDVTVFCDMIRSGHRLDKPHSCPADLYELMRNCWNVDPSARPSFSNIVTYLTELLNYYTNDSFVNVDRAMMRGDLIGAHRYDVISYAPSSSRTVFTYAYQTMGEPLSNYENT